ncbi:NADH dehydrogenase [ubiquinone] 1 beta subcomplex subunit 9 isoform X2 [Lepeophtheirus salmonis]|uniref:NADH dehydrogenase [ubiquinone] 1 beta subcomplex subunit 9 n=1 Tax=Lepeophtheirus salmonis TaxID=72036 RepID=D3PHM5_LEPSM|nr:NADH dehydrogenase [ubiquinone] 1 beta subcomplex subunit 9-like [Lepeophtheirus salmonis]ADD38061.1 NADH dehydrogenase 1 beta subcomplex subunit 9 [Lepeophtheirus salmonis]
MPVSLEPKTILTHAQRVCRLYKRALRTIEDYEHNRLEARFQAVQMRDRFEKTRKEKDLRVLAAILEAGEREHFEKKHPIPFKFLNDPGALAFERTVDSPDHVLDLWHPWEKANFIDYFNKREKKKEEYHEYFEKVIAVKFRDDLKPSVGKSPV